LSHICQMTTLKILDVSISGITDAGIFYICNLHQLKELNISHCYNLTDACVPHIKNMSLQKLTMHDCLRIRMSDLHSYARVPHIQNMSLRKLTIHECLKIRKSKMLCT